MHLYHPQLGLAQQYRVMRAGHHVEYDTFLNAETWENMTPQIQNLYDFGSPAQDWGAGIVLSMGLRKKRFG